MKRTPFLGALESIQHTTPDFTPPTRLRLRAAGAIGWLVLGLEERSLTGLLDNSPVKQGRRLYGTGLTVFAADRLRGARNPLVILNAGAHNTEIAAGLRALRPDVRIAGNP